MNNLLTTIYLSDFKTGLYILHMKNIAGQMSKKVIVNLSCNNILK